MSIVHGFADKFAFSRGQREKTDLDTIKVQLTGCVSVVKTDEHMDRTGIDYIATLRGGAEVLIDGKTRTPGCSKYWRRGPELALEIWSVRPGGKYGTPTERRKTGWTLNEKSNVDMIFFSFDPKDTADVYLIGFQGLRMAFHQHFDMWKERYKRDVQDSGGWESECLFVPVSEVQDAIAVAARNVSRGVDGMPLFGEELAGYSP